MAEIQAVLFDYGGVLAEEGFSNGLQRLAREQGLDVDTITDSGMQAVYDSGFVLGKGSEAGFWALLRERTGLQGDDAFFRQQIFNGFVIRPWMLELVSKLSSRGYVTGILSDQVDWLDTLDARDHFYSYFDHIYNSFYIGKGKRDPSQFTDVAADLGLSPAKILFIDDSERNVATAKSTGMQAIQYVDRQSFIKKLAERLDIEQL
ncbi:MAG: HAD family phosphatase [Gammaproteobacteria bacterium]|jgi:putative hydrolase of the HAD superfamily